MKITKNIRSWATEVILNEANALTKVNGLIDSDFEGCVNEIYNSKGRVVVTGIGKSAIIANKIVATFNSTGTPSLFMHAGDAIHGDLGMIGADDIVICLSKSGNTAEIKELVPLIKRLGVKLIGLVSNVDSYLATHSDYVINGTIDEEACPNNLAPTTSTTVHLALGDAIAVCLLKLRGFSSEDFARIHPGGSLGKKLYLLVDDIIASNELPTVDEDALSSEVIIEISSKRLGATAVLDEKDELAGIITDGDLRRMIETREDWKVVEAKEIMSTQPRTIELGSHAVKALEIMQANSITQLVVLNKNKVAGFVHLHDLLREGIV